MSNEQLAMSCAVLVVLNIAAVIKGFVSIKVAIGKLEVHVDILKKNVNDIGKSLKQIKNQEG